MVKKKHLTLIPCNPDVKYGPKKSVRERLKVWEERRQKAYALLWHSTVMPLEQSITESWLKKFFKR